eukprot:GSMAST32.ASY1.ANO1.447.1 assembled CDS
MMDVDLSDSILWILLILWLGTKNWYKKTPISNLLFQNSDFLFQKKNKKKFKKSKTLKKKIEEKTYQTYILYNIFIQSTKMEEKIENPTQDHYNTEVNEDKSVFEKKLSWKQAAFNTFFYMFGASQLPYAVGQMGFTIGTLFIVALSISSWWSGHLLVDICVKRKVHDWPSVAHEAYGKRGRFWVEILQTSAFILTGIVQVQGSGSLWQQSFPDTPICQWQWILINTIPYLLFLQIPSFGNNKPMVIATIVTIGTTIFRTVLIFYFFAAEGKYCHVCYSGQTITSIFAAAANLVFTFGSHAMYIFNIFIMILIFFFQVFFF